MNRTLRMLTLNDPSLLATQSIIGDLSLPEDKSCPVINPASQEVITSVSVIEESYLPAALACAQAAQEPWASCSGMQRGSVLRRWGDLLLTHEQDLAHVITCEQGKPFAEALAEIAYAADYFHWFAGEAERVYGRTLPVSDNRRFCVEQRPLGVIAAITPWNFPAAMLARKLGAALAAGNAVIAKPAIETPLTALAMVRLGVRAGIPQGLVNVVLSDQPEQVGNWVCREPGIAKITFTGSTSVGTWLLQRAGAEVKPCTMELGGNAPFIVFDDADLPAAVDGFMASKFRNAGQTCISANRLLLQKTISAEFLSLLKLKLRGLKYGDGMRAEINLGPLIHSNACARLQAKIDEAMQLGACVEHFGQDLRDKLSGSFFAPTLVTGVTPSMRLFAEESFGPVVTLTQFSDCEEAITLANQTSYGLAAYVYSRTLPRINQCQKQLQFGMLGINEARLSHVFAPFGGVKNSGFGREGGLEGISHYLSQQFIAWGE